MLQLTRVRVRANCRVKKHVSQLFSGFCEARESSKEQSTDIKLDTMLCVLVMLACNIFR